MFIVNKRSEKKSRRRRTTVAKGGNNQKDVDDHKVNEKERETKLRMQQATNSYFYQRRIINKESQEWQQMQKVVQKKGWLSFRSDLNLVETFIGPAGNKYKVNETKEGDVWYTRILTAEKNSNDPKAEEGDCW